MNKTSIYQKLPPCINDKNRKSTVWSVLSNEEVDLFNRNVICTNYKLGETVFMQGEPSKGLYFVSNGLVGIRKIEYEGESTLIRVVGKWGTLGYRPFLAQQAHQANAEIIEDSKICFIDNATVRGILQNNHKLAMKLLKRMAQELGNAEERLLEIATLSVDTRLIHMLILYHDKWGRYSVDGSVKIILPITRDDIASMIGAHPDSITRAFKLLESKGVLKTNGRQIYIEEFDRLVEQLHINKPG